MNYSMDKCIHPIMKKREGKLILERLKNQMKKDGLEYLILMEKNNINYVTGYIPIVGASVAVVPAEGEVTLIISTLESQDAWCTTKDVNIKEFMSWVFIDDGTDESRLDKGDIMDPEALFKLTCETMNIGSLSGNVGYEPGFMTIDIYKKMTALITAEKMIDCTKLLSIARMRKTPWEISMVKRAAQQLERIYEAVGSELKPGMPEFMLHKLFVKYAAEFDELGLSGRQHSFIPAVGPYYGLCGMPRGYALKSGDIVKFDVGFQYLGFHSDIARTYAVGGTASDEAMEIYDVLYHANRLAVSNLKPGMKCNEIYQIARDYVESHSKHLTKYPRGHVGHSVGCSWSAEEYPQLSPRNDIVLETGMTFSLETPYSATGNAVVHGGFNLEDTFVITKDGYEAFTEVPDNLFGKKEHGEYCPADKVIHIKKGGVLVDTPEEDYVPLNRMLGGTKAAVVFLRSYACKLTQLEVVNLKQQYEEILQSGGKVIVVVQSNRGIMLQELDENPVPFQVICDRNGKLYEKHNIVAAKDEEQLSGDKAKEKLDKADELELVHGFDEGEPLQLPGVVYFNSDGEVVDKYLAKEAGDLPSVKEIADILSRMC